MKKVNFRGGELSWSGLAIYRVWPTQTGKYGRSNLKIALSPRPGGVRRLPAAYLQILRIKSRQSSTWGLMLKLRINPQVEDWKFGMCQNLIEMFRNVRRRQVTYAKNRLFTFLILVLSWMLKFWNLINRLWGNQKNDPEIQSSTWGLILNILRIGSILNLRIG